MRDLDNAEQKKELLTLVEKIKKQTSNKDDQARIATSIVQNIPYDWEGFTTNDLGAKYPYEVLYTMSGVCGEKSELLVFLLSELGFGVAIFEYDMESHRAVGIKCPIQYSYQNSGYCFIETTNPTIITDSSGEYINTGQLGSPSEIIIISEGISFDSVSEEYNDAKEYNALIAKGTVLNHTDYLKWIGLSNKYGIQTSDSDTQNLTEESCPINTTLCNNVCWENCNKGTFKCTLTGAVCEIRN